MEGSNDKTGLDNSITNSPFNLDEPLLGSLTTYNNTEGSELKSQQIRSSARVFKKMKLDLTPSVTVVEKREKKEEVKQDKKVFRPLWSSDDKTIFFEALNEFGKDFESIQTYISSKLRKKGVPDNLIKTRDQIRHLYYRTWHKISKHLRFAEGIKKVAQELYGLINYGELRKKIGAVSEKACMKLNELIYVGSIVLRIKGKNVRIKTPMCRALRRLNQLDEKYDEIQLPTRVTIEVRPKDMTSFLKVQMMAQNPRLKTILPLQKRLSGLLCCINKRWKTVDANIYDKSVTSTNVATNDCVPPDKELQENKLLFTPPLRLSPPANSKIEIPSINLSEYFTRQSICLASYEQRVGVKSLDEPYGKSPKKGFRQRTDSASEKLAKHNASTSVSDNLVNEVVNEAVNTILALQTEKQEVEDNKLIEQTKIKLEVDAVSEQKIAQTNKIRNGWTEADCQTLTIGEIYLMFGSDSKVVLEYSWDSPPTVKLETNELAQEETIEDEGTIKGKDLSNSLSKLLSVAKLHYRKNMIKCPCGHVCGSKNNVQLKRAVETKIRKILTDIEKSTDESEDKSTDETVFENENSFVAPPVYIQSNIRRISPATIFHPPNTSMVHLITNQIDSIKRLMPRYCNRRGRRPSKPVVVERKLPLLPNRVESGHQIVRMNIISQGETKPQTQPNTSLEEAKETNKEPVQPLNFNNITSSNTLNTNQTFMDVPLEGTSSDSVLLRDTDNDVDINEILNENAISTAPSSPSRILKENDSQSWINAEVADYSLSSLLGNLESPMKCGPLNENSHLCQDVDAQLQSLLTESSLDFSASFADLAAQVISDIKK